MNEPIDVGQLFAAYVRGEISAEQLQTLEAFLRENSELRREFIEYMNVDSSLGDLAALSRAEAAEIEPAVTATASEADFAGETRPHPVSVIERFRTHRVLLIAGAVAATLLLTTVLWVPEPEATTDTTVATLVSGVDASLFCDGQFCTDTDLTTGRYQLKQGLMHLRFSSGVMVYVEAPAMFDAVSGKRVVLHSGRLSASVPPEGIGFVVETPAAEVVDFGTEFSVDVEDGASEVHVFKGLVRVHPGGATQRDPSRSLDLQASQAVRITDGTTEPVEISIATDRFIRDFDEPRLNYACAVKLLSPLAYYRMAIRDRGLVSETPGYSGVVLLGEGKRPPHARGVFVGGSLQVGADSTGRGGRVDSPPTWHTGQYSLAVFVYLEASAESAIVATNLNGELGNFEVSLDEHGMLQAAIRSENGELSTITGGSVLPPRTWRHIVVTADGEQLQLYEDGKLAASAPCGPLAASDSATAWFGTDAGANQVWNGRIDELALFDRALTEEEIASLYHTAQEEIARSQ